MPIPDDSERGPGREQQGWPPGKPGGEISYSPPFIAGWVNAGNIISKGWHRAARGIDCDGRPVNRIEPCRPPRWWTEGTEGTEGTANRPQGSEDEWVENDDW